MVKLKPHMASRDILKRRRGKKEKRGKKKQKRPPCQGLHKGQRINMGIEEAFPLS